LVVRLPIERPKPCRGVPLLRPLLDDGPGSICCRSPAAHPARSGFRSAPPCPSPVPARVHVWTAPDAQAENLTSLCRKQSCLRPLCAVEPLAQIKSADQVPIKITRSPGALTPWGVLIPGSTGLSSFLSLDALTFAARQPVIRLGPRKLRSAARSPRRCVRSCWPEPPPRPLAACALSAATTKPSPGRPAG
jgi:hypothetical protein